MATMKDIARLAQVSTSTVSHVINGSRFVSDEIRDKVMRIVVELNYTPSYIARSLKVKTTKTIGLLVTATNNPFFSEVMAGVEQYCQKNQYNLIIATTGGDAKRLQQNLQTLIHKQVVVMDWWFTELNADKILENSERGGYLATKSMVDAGHQKIGIITGNLRKSVAKNRLQGYKKALSEANIVLNPDWIVESHFDFEGGIVGAQKLLALSDRPTAIFCCSDTIAIGAYQAIQNQGLRIPQDISIMGYDDIELARYLFPSLSTISQPKAELGKLAVETLLQRIQEPNENYRTLVLEPTCILRESISSPSNVKIK